MDRDDGEPEIGLNLRGEFPKPLTDDVVPAADVVITMGCGDTCPVYPGKKYEDWDIPAILTLGGVREVRDVLRTRVRNLVSQLIDHPSPIDRDSPTSKGNTA